jgi:hypothetical protein
MFVRKQKMKNVLLLAVVSWATLTCSNAVIDWRDLVGTDGVLKSCKKIPITLANAAGGMWFFRECRVNNQSVETGLTPIGIPL